jgi:hypothetical protein
MHRTAAYRFVYVNISVSDLNVVSAIQISADPRFVVDRRTLRAEVGQRYKITGFAFLTLGERFIFHESHLPSKIPS